ncbi:MAG: F0F1 ATP synthase subunit delta [Puniceicoccales bacterium]|jgi:hypothetical protein|nr:F0F1 ATP synthase subunit delta [Puniceicoccales bacterium]
MIRIETRTRTVRKIVRHLLSLPDLQRGFEAVLLQARQLPRQNGVDFLKSLHQELVRLQPYTKDRVETPDSLESKELTKIINSFSSFLGRPVALQSVQNLTLLGGVCVTIGDQRWERSIRNCLRIFSC